MTRRTTYFARTDGIKIELTKQNHTKLADAGKQQLRTFTLAKKKKFDEISNDLQRDFS